MSKEKKFVGRNPDYKGSIPIVAWKNKDREGKDCLRVKVDSKFTLYPVDS